MFATRHGKERQARAPFRELLGARVVDPTTHGVDLDTDQFGTFSGERPRTLTPLGAALAKAHLAIAATGLPLALASEASYGTIPAVGWPGHEELLLFLDATRGIQVAERALSFAVPARTWRLQDPEQIPFDQLARLGWPQQATLVRAENGAVTAKGVVDEATLLTAVETATRLSTTHTALIEPDLRAHHNPTRQKVLEELCVRLARRLATPCPDCSAPGWGQTTTTPGLPCRWCQTPTSQTAVTTFGCAACPASQDIPARSLADPGHCPQCNP